MRASSRVCSMAFLLLAFIFYGITAHAVTGQRYFGDGAQANPDGTWNFTVANDGHCLVCHVPGNDWNFAPDKTSYLMTGHKNAMRKATVNSPWAGPDSLIYDTDSSGHAILWNMLGTVVLGSATNYPPLLDGACSLTGYPDQSSCLSAGGQWTSGSKSVFYIYGGWMRSVDLAFNQPGSSIATPGSLANGDSFSCARCHTTGLTLDSTLSSARPPELTYPGISSYVNFDPDGNGPALYVSWATNTVTGRTLEGVQCDRCHDATNHRGGIGPATIPTGVAATALCLECHRQEHIVSYTGNGLGSNINPTPFVDNPGIPVSEPTISLPFIEVSRDAPQFYGYSIGMEYLNSVHAEFTGNFQQIKDTTKYLSSFIASSTDGGCTKCHDVHQSTVAAVNAAAPFKNDCPTCHAEGSSAGLANIIHPKGPGTPFADPANIPAACHTCHMPKPNNGNGHAAHLWRIKSDASYTTFPTQAEYDAGQTTAYTAPTVTHSYPNAVWLDVDLVCGQCHGSSSGQAGGIPQFTKTQLAPVAAGMHTGIVGAQYCLLCHSTQQGAQPPVQQGVNHHIGSCDQCHGTSSWPLHKKAPAPACTTCHSWFSLNTMNHPVYPGSTPSTCETCHAYSAVLSDQTTTTYSWPGVIPTDTDHVCGQCHGGSAGPGSVTHNAPYFDAATLAFDANNIHNARPTARFTWTTDPSLNYSVLFNASTSVCPSGAACTYSLDFGDGNSTVLSPSNLTASHVYADTTTRTATLTVTTDVAGNSTFSSSVTPVYVASTPTAVAISGSQLSGYTATINYTLSGGIAPYTVKATWGDGYVTTQTGVGSGASSTAHAYANAGSYTVTITATDSGLNGTHVTTGSASTGISISAGSYSISGRVTRVDGVTPVASASVTLKLNGVTKKLVYTNSTGNYTMTAVTPGTYTVTVAKSGLTFANPAATVTVTSSNLTGVDIRSLN